MIIYQLTWIKTTNVVFLMKFFALVPEPYRIFYHEINKTSIAETNAHCTNHGSEQITDYLNNICDVADLGINKTLIEEKSTDGTNLGTEQILQNDIVPDAEHQEVLIEFIDQRQSNISKDKCSCSQKILNKIDYFQKKMLKELGRYRQETMQVIRGFSDRYDVLLNSNECRAVVPERELANEARNVEFENQFNNDFPVKGKLLLIKTDNTIKTDR